MFRNILSLLCWRFVSVSQNHEAGEPPLAGCLRLIIQYIRIYLEDSGGRT